MVVVVSIVIKDILVFVIVFILRKVVKLGWLEKLGFSGKLEFNNSG